MAMVKEKKVPYGKEKELGDDVDWRNERNIPGLVAVVL
jgi:hypothetical protein